MTKFPISNHWLFEALSDDASFMYVTKGHCNVWMLMNWMEAGSRRNHIGYDTFEEMMDAKETDDAAATSHTAFLDFVDDELYNTPMVVAFADRLHAFSATGSAQILVQDLNDIIIQHSPRKSEKNCKAWHSTSKVKKVMDTYPSQRLMEESDLAELLAMYDVHSSVANAAESIAMQEVIIVKLMGAKMCLMMDSVTKKILKTEKQASLLRPQYSSIWSFGSGFTAPRGRVRDNYYWKNMVLLPEGLNLQQGGGVLYLWSKDEMRRCYYTLKDLHLEFRHIIKMNQLSKFKHLQLTRVWQSIHKAYRSQLSLVASQV